MRDDRWSEAPGVLRVALFRSQGRLEAEIVILRHQPNVLRRRTPLRARLTLIDRRLALSAAPVRAELNAVTIDHPGVEQGRRLGFSRHSVA
jgi:hypothetical protein